jgi:hypothetical protein
MLGRERSVLTLQHVNTAATLGRRHMQKSVQPNQVTHQLQLQVAVKVMPKQRGKLTKERTLQKLAKEVSS